MNPAAVRAIGRPIWLAAGCVLAVFWAPILCDGPVADEAVINPYLGDAQAIAEGRRIYRTRCVICHRGAGGRGPNLFASELRAEQFLETVINGRNGTGMPAFGWRMSPDDVWKVHAFIRSTDRY